MRVAIAAATGLVSALASVDRLAAEQASAKWGTATLSSSAVPLWGSWHASARDNVRHRRAGIKRPQMRTLQMLKSETPSGHHTLSPQSFGHPHPLLAHNGVTYEMHHFSPVKIKFNPKSSSGSKLVDHP